MSGSFRIGTPRVVHSAEGSSVSARVVTPQGELELRCDVTPAGPLSGLGDVFIPPVLMAAMVKGLPVVSEAPVSSRLLLALPRLQATLAGWSPDLVTVPVQAPPTSEAVRGAGIGSLYSGGVDSCDTLLRFASSLTHLVMIHGFETAAAAPGRAELGRLAREVAGEFGVTLVEVRTNLNEALLPGHGRFWIQHGAFLATAGHCVAPRLGRLYVPSSTFAGERLGSHPDVDPLWSGEGLEFVHDEGEPTRCGKVRRIVQHPFLLERLRVCQSGQSPGRNCGRCEKCVRTLVNLRLAGVLDPVAFDEPLKLGRVRYARIGWLAQPYVRESLRVAEQQGTDPALIEALRDCAGMHPWRGWRRPFTHLMTSFWKLREQLWS